MSSSNSSNTSEDLNAFEFRDDSIDMIEENQSVEMLKTSPKRVAEDIPELIKPAKVKII